MWFFIPPPLYLDVQEGVQQDQPALDYSGSFAPTWQSMKPSTSGEYRISG